MYPKNPPQALSSYPVCPQTGHVCHALPSGHMSERTYLTRCCSTLYYFEGWPDKNQTAEVAYNYPSTKTLRKTSPTMGVTYQMSCHVQRISEGRRYIYTERITPLFCTSIVRRSTSSHQARTAAVVRPFFPTGWTSSLLPAGSSRCPWHAPRGRGRCSPTPCTRCSTAVAKKRDYCGR